MTPQEQDLCRWLYLVAGFSRKKLARDFETTIAEVEEVVSTGLGEILCPGHVQPSAPIIALGALAAPLTEVVGRSNEEREWLRKVFSRALR